MRQSLFRATAAAAVFLHPLVFLGLLLWPTSPRAQELSPSPDLRYAITDGEVRAFADGGDVVYLGGTFGYVGPYTGGWATLDATTGTPSGRWPLVHGKVTAMEPDGEGGWFIGGQFQQVGDHPCSHLAHLRADGSVDTDWQVTLQGTASEPAMVTALVLSGDTVYFAGEFRGVGGEIRQDMAAVDARTGSLRPWDPAPAGHTFGSIRGLVAQGDHIYVGGDFTAIGGAVRSGVAGLDKDTGKASSLNLPVEGWVNVLAVSGMTLYFGGEFGSVNNQLRNSAAAVDLTTLELLPWNPPASRVYDLEVASDRVFIADGLEVLLAVDPIWGLLTPGQPGLKGAGTALAKAGNSLIVGGYFYDVGNEPLSYLLMVDADTLTVVAGHPSIGGVPTALAAFGEEIGVGGVSSVGGQRRNNLAAVDKMTGGVTDWAPRVGPMDAQVQCLAIANGSIIAGGAFLEVNGQAITNLVLLNRLGQETALVTPSARVLALAVTDDTLYLGGRFTRCNGLTRRSLAAVSLTTGELLEWNPGTSGRVNALVPGADGLFVGGNFTNIAGLSRNYLAKLDFATGQATGWNAALLTAANNEINALALTDDRLHAGGVFSVRIGGTTYRSLVSITAATAAAEGFFPPPSISPLQTLNSLVAADDAVWMGGYSGNGLESSSLRQASRLTHQVTGWNPRSDQTVYAQLWDGENLFVGGDFTMVAGESLHGLAVFRRLEEAITIAKSSLKILAPTGVSFEVLAGIGRKFAVESSLDFNQWEELETQTATASRTTITDPRPLGAARYYRVSAR